MAAIGDFTAKALQKVGLGSLGRQAADAASQREGSLLEALKGAPALKPDALNVSAAATSAAKARANGPQGNVLLTYLSAGNGHQKAAEAIEEALHRKYPGIKVTTVDMASVSKVGRWSAKLFYPLVNSGLYPKFYEFTNKPIKTTGLMGRLTRWFTQKTSGDFLNLVRQTKPDAVVSTHLMGAHLIGDAMDMGTLPKTIHNFQVVTDEYGHGTYVMGHLDGTFVPSSEVADQLAAKGLSKQGIQVTGIPINPVFADAPKAGVRKALGFGSNSRVLLVQGNLVNDVAQYKALLSQLVAKYPKGVDGQPIEVAVACGKNDALKQQLDALAKTYNGAIRIKPFGMLNAGQMRDLMQASDLSLTKPGGLTTAESVATGLPMVLLDVMKGGQETYNAEHFTQLGASVSTHDVPEATQQVVSLLGDSQRLQSMHTAAQRLGKPNAASQIADTTAASLRGVSP